MRNNATLQEILLFTETRFVEKKCIEKSDSENNADIPQKDKLKSACWNGLASDMLPEVCEKKYDPSITLWEVFEAEHFLELVYGNHFEMADNSLSINPYQYLESKNYN